MFQLNSQVFKSLALEVSYFHPRKLSSGANPAITGKNRDNGYSELSWSGVNIFVFQKETRSRAEPSGRKKSNVAVNIERCDEAMQRLKSSSRNLL